VDEGSHVSRHGLRLLADAKSWSDPNGLADAMPVTGIEPPSAAPLPFREGSSPPTPPHSRAFGVSSFFGRIASAALNSPKVWLT
jgi:hypothetical protein